MEQTNLVEPAPKHARISPSKLDYIAICAARVDREPNYADETSAASERGTRLHLAGAERIEQALEDGYETPTYDALVEEGDAEGVAMVDAYVNYILRRKAELDPCAVRVEVLVDPGRWIGRTDHWGTCDCALVSNTVLEAVDFKTGGWLVEPTTLQTKDYLVGLLHQYTDAGGKTFPFETVRSTIFQPKRPGQQEIARWVDYTIEELLAWKDNELTAICAATDGVFYHDGLRQIWDASYPPPIGDGWRRIEDPIAVPSDSCKFCEARNDCPELQESITGAMDELTQGTGDLDLLFSQEPVAAMSVEQLTQLLNIRPLIEARLKARFGEAEERVTGMLKEHQPVPGWKLVRGASTRKWAIPEADLIKKLKNLKLKKDQIFEEVLRSPAKMQSVGLPVEKWQAVMKYIVKPEGALVLAPESDTRENALPVEMFQPVAEMKFANGSAITFVDSGEKQFRGSGATMVWTDSDDIPPIPEIPDFLT